MCASVTIEIAPGELIDKLTILDIKLDRLHDGDRRRNVNTERELLAGAFEGLSASPPVAALMARLRGVNEALWVIEDEIRDCERNCDFGPIFVGLARAVYKTNDERAEIKRAINVMLGSRIIEEKSYAPYA